MRKTNEAGEPVPAIYDTKGLLSVISTNCDEIKREPLTPEQRSYVDGILSLVQELIDSAGK